MPLLGAGAATVYLARSARRSRTAEAHAQAERDASFVELIESVSAATAQARTKEEALFPAVDRICRWTTWPVGHAYMVGRGTEDPLEPSSVWILRPPERFEPFQRATQRMRMPTGVGLFGRVLASGRPAWIVDVTRDTNFPRRPACEQVGLRGAFSFPVVAAERVYAIVECFSPESVRPDQRLLEVTAHIGRQVGRVIQALDIEAALRESETRFRSVAQSASDAIVAADQDGAIISWNRGAEQVFGYTEPEVVGKPLSLLMPERFRALHDAGIRRIVTEGVAASRVIGSTLEAAGLRKDQSEFPLELSLATWETPNGRFFSGIIRDITERKKAAEKIKALLETAPDPIVEIDGDGRIVLANARTDELFGYSRSEILGQPIEDLFAQRCRQLIGERFRAVIAGADAGGSLTDGQDMWGQRKDGSEFAVEVTVSALSTAAGTTITSIIRDVTERRRFERQLKHLADHDALTELFNRRRFEHELEDYGEYVQRYKEHGAVLLLDLDRFKYVNDAHGHKAGDEVIRATGNALRSSLRSTDVVARLGGDEFAVLLKNADRAEAERTARRMLEIVRERELPIEGRRAPMTTSIGVALFDEDVIVENLLVNADLAMYSAKEAGGNRYEVSGDHDEQLSGMQTRLGWVNQIRRGIDDDGFELFCQPIMHLASGQVTQWELLLRLRGEDGELIPPLAFIPTAERFGMIQEIDRWVVMHAIELLDRLRDHPGGIRFEVNVSGKSLSDPQYLELVEHEVAARAIDPGDLVFEITETAAIANMEEARTFADRLTRLGCRFALDDFGAGFSSFYYLKYLPLNYVKIDGDFIRGLTSSTTDQLVVQSIVDIARGMGMKTIAEFVEGPETAELLRKKGVDYSQGYYHGRPRPVVVEFGLAAQADGRADRPSPQAPAALETQGLDRP